ncbi:MAG TPA: formate dehydrogenase subunit alpha, partial [Erythrobacter sp.]|nr:formate dehydrogenase subunit alpha [Erythrobacter sp.]
EKENSVTYPCNSPTSKGQDVVFEEGFPIEGGRGKFVPAKILPSDELPDEEFSMVLTTGRQLEHWHTGAMTRRASNLNAIEPEPTVSLSPEDIERVNLNPGDYVTVTTRRGSIKLRIRQDVSIPKGLIFIPFCYYEAAANILTNAALDPYGKIPEFKYCAAKLENLSQ